MNIFDFNDYKEYCRKVVQSKPKRGHGEYRRIALHLGLHTTSVSHIFRGTLDLSLEHALQLAQYFGLTQLETDYFLCLVEHAKAGTAQLRAYQAERLKKIREQSLDLSQRLPKQQVLSNQDRAIFYSHWYYSGIRLLTSVEKYRDVEQIAAQLKLPKKLVVEAIEFLLSTGLCKRTDDGLTYGPMRTHIEASSLLAPRHHVNWRMKTMDRFTNLDDDELVFTSPVTLSREDFKRLKNEIVQFIESFNKIATPSTPEKLACLNIDWVEVRG